MLDIILKHRTIRKYKSTKIDKEIVEKIIEAAIRGSNTGNMQMYSIIISTDEKIKQQLWEVHFKQNMVLEAPMIITFVADINRFHKWCELNDAGIAYDNFLWLYNATIDATIAAQNACVAAESYDLGICYLGTTTYNARKIIQILDLPKGVVPVTSIVIGYPNDNPPLTDRLPIESIVFWEKYSDFSDEQIFNCFNDRDNSEQTKMLIEQNKTQNLAQVFTQKRYKKEDNVYFSNEFLDVLKEQGFMNQ